MNAFLNRYATPLTLGLFAVSTISGVALFFHVAQGTFHAMHEWLSMVLLAPFALHVWKNWAALVAYLRRGTLLLPVAASLVAGVFFAWPASSGGEGGPPPIRAARLMTQVPLKDLAPVLKTTPDALQGSLRQRGYEVASADQTLAAVAASAGVPAEELLFGLLPTR